MDIDYLLFLQDLRNATGGIFDEFFNSISKFAVDILPMLSFVLFWCVDKKWGYRFIVTHRIGSLINGIIKLTVCAYRPWIRSDLIEPAGDSKVSATGYSFPSGHTMTATAICGSTVVWQRKKRRWIAVLCIVLILLTAFSRNFLGVHTPQDVLVALAESIVVIFIVNKVADKIGENDKVIDILTIIGCFFLIAVILYVTFKPYPMDYVNGELLVDPKTMLKDVFGASGAVFGLLLGSFIERHWLHYEIPKGSANLGLLTAIGLGILIAWDTWFASATVVQLFGRDWGNYVAKFLMVFFAIVIWPLVIRKFNKAETN